VGIHDSKVTSLRKVGGFFLSVLAAEEVAAQSELSPLDVRVELIYQRLAAGGGHWSETQTNGGGSMELEPF